MAIPSAKPTKIIVRPSISGFSVALAIAAIEILATAYAAPIAQIVTDKDMAMNFTDSTSASGIVIFCSIAAVGDRLLKRINEIIDRIGKIVLKLVFMVASSIL